MSDKMTSQEAERRVDSVFLCGGTPDEKRFALKRWQAAMKRDWKAGLKDAEEKSKDKQRRATSAPKS